MVENTRYIFDRTRFQKPQVNLARSTTGRMWLVNICAFITILQSSFSDSFSSLAVAGGAVAAAVLTEILFLYKDKRAVILKDGSAVASALILTLLLPNHISPLYAALGAAFAMAIVKHSFGGLGSNWLNPAAGGWLFIRFSWPASFSQALEGSPLFLHPEGLEQLPSIPPAGFAIFSFLNRTVFNFLGAELPLGHMYLFASPYPGIIADRGITALLFGTIIIIAFHTNRSWIPAAYLAVFCFLYHLAGALPHGGSFWEGDVLYGICTGATLVAAFLLAAEPATGAKSRRGIFLTVLLGAILAFMIRFFSAEPYGAIYAAIFINAITPLIRHFENLGLYKKMTAAWSMGGNL